MKGIFMATVLIWAASISVSAQTDTIYVSYLNAQKKECAEDTAKYLRQIFKKENLWHRKDVRLADKKIQLYETATDAHFTFKRDTCRYYYPQGNIKEEFIYPESGNIERFYFYPSGQRGAYVKYNKGKITIQKGWDSTGQEIPDYIFERPAEFPGGKDSWWSFLKRNLNPAITGKENAPPGRYTVYVTIQLDNKGNVVNVQANNNPGYGTVEEALRVAYLSPKWTPAILFNHPVAFKAKQAISFNVVNK